MSVARMMDRGHEIIFSKDHAIVQDLRGNVKMFAERRGNLFFIKVSHQEANAATDVKNKKIELWHRRFDHLNFRDLHAMKKNLDVTGLDFPDSETVSDCKICLAAKSPALCQKDRQDHLRNYT